MNIAYIGKFNHIYDEEGFARSLEALGHTVYRFEEYGVVNIRPIFDCQPDFILFAKLKIYPHLRDTLIERAKEEDIPTICYVPDLYFGISRERHIIGSDAIFRADLVLTPDGGHDAFWEQYKVNHRVLRQGIYQDFCYFGKTEETPHKIVFVGSDNPEFPYRHDLMDRLEKRYGDMFCWIGRTNTHAAREHDLNTIYASADIIIGDSVYSPKYWSNRIYETLGRGGFLIHPVTEGLEEEYTPFEHFIPYYYGDYKGLYEKIDYYLQKPLNRFDISKQAMEYTKEHHTLLHRAEELLQYYEDILA